MEVSVRVAWLSARSCSIYTTVTKFYVALDEKIWIDLAIDDETYLVCK